MRVAAGALGGAGLLLAASTTVWPTTVFAVRVPEVGDFTKGYEQHVWSWGRQVVYSSDGLVLDAFAGPDPVARLVLLAAVLLLGAAGLVTGVVVGGRRGELLAGIGLGLAVGVVGSSVVERWSFDVRSIGLQPGLVEVTTPSGWLEAVSVPVLLAVLAVLALPVVLPGPTAAASRRVAVVVARLRSPEDSAPGHLATLQEAASPGTTHTPAVGFRDDPDDPDDPGDPAGRGREPGRPGR